MEKECDFIKMQNEFFSSKLKKITLNTLLE